MLSEREIFIRACGRTADGFAKSAIKIDDADINVNTHEENILNELMLDNPVVNIFRNAKMTMLDLTFDNPEDYEFHHLIGFLQNATSLDRTMDTVSDTVPSVIITICPKELEFEYYITGLHAIWCLQPSQIDGPIDTVRFIFTNDLFHVYHMNVDAILKEMDANIN